VKSAFTLIHQTNNKMKIQDLKNNRDYIIARIIELGCEEKLKSFMELIVLELEFKKDSTIDELISEVYEMSFRERRKKSGQKLAEIVGNNEYRTYSIMDKKYIYN